MASLHGLDGHALLLDCHELTIEPVPLPEGAEIVVKYISHRTVAGSPIRTGWRPASPPKR